MENNDRPKVGIAVIIFRNNKILLGKRKGSHGEGEYSSPGGHLEYMESIEECAKREVLEETGMEIENIKFLRLMNLKDYNPKHYIDIAVTCDWKSGEPKVMEPEKCEAWGWYSIDEIPTQLFKSFPSIIEALKTGKNYFDN
jgi:8-oxo-dGTP diphosphatase